MKALHYLSALVCIVLMGTGCSMSEKGDTGGENTSGQGGSLARFTIKGDYLYTVDVSSLHTFSLADREHPVKKHDLSLGFYTETIFPYEDALLLGTTEGMYVISTTDPAVPKQKAFFTHIASCDPVVAQDGYAYLTLNTSNQRCWRGSNQLQIIDIRNLSNPSWVMTYQMLNPLGLDINNDSLYVCENGLEVWDVSDKTKMKLLQSFSDIDAKDVIYNNGNLVVIGTGGLHQYRITGSTIEKLSTVPVIP